MAAKQVPRCCAEQTDARRRKEGCAATDEWLVARVGRRTAEWLEQRLEAEEGGGRITAGRPTAAAVKVLAAAGVRASRLPDHIRAVDLFLERGAAVVAGGAPPLLRLRLGAVFWVKIQRFAWCASLPTQFPWALSTRFDNFRK